jgi:hypothetical protein
MHRANLRVLEQEYDVLFYNLLEGLDCGALKPANRQWRMTSDTLGIQHFFESMRPM